MQHLAGLREYLDRHDETSVFDHALSEGSPWTVHLHGRLTATARVVENKRYEVVLDVEGEGRQEVSKTLVQFLYPAELAEKAAKRIRTDPEVAARRLEPIIPPKERHHVKNKTLYPLLRERTVVFFTMLEGAVLRGLVSAFSRYEITVDLKGGIPVVLLRHAVYDLRDKAGRCLLKSVQDTRRDWQKSSCWVGSP